MPTSPIDPFRWILDPGSCLGRDCRSRTIRGQSHVFEFADQLREWASNRKSHAKERIGIAFRARRERRSLPATRQRLSRPLAPAASPLAPPQHPPTRPRNPPDPPPSSAAAIARHPGCAAPDAPQTPARVNGHPNLPICGHRKFPTPGDQLTSSVAAWTMPDLSLSLSR